MLKVAAICLQKPEDVPLEEKQLAKALRHSITHKFPTIICPSRFAMKVRPACSVCDKRTADA